MQYKTLLRASVKPLPQPIPLIPSLLSLSLHSFILSLPDLSFEVPQQTTTTTTTKPSKQPKKRSKATSTPQTGIGNNPSNNSNNNNNNSSICQRIFQTLPRELINLLLLRIFESSNNNNESNLYVNSKILAKKIQQYYLFLKIEELKHDSNQNNNNNNNNNNSDEGLQLALNFRYFIKNHQDIFGLNNIFNNHIKLIRTFLRVLVLDASNAIRIGKENCKIIRFASPLRKLVFYSGKASYSIALFVRPDSINDRLESSIPSYNFEN